MVRCIVTLMYKLFLKLGNILFDNLSPAQDHGRQQFVFVKPGLLIDRYEALNGRTLSVCDPDLISELRKFIVVIKNAIQ